jgi:hypothetical protein
MKKNLLSLSLFLVLNGFVFAQTNSTGGTNYYSSFVNEMAPPLTASMSQALVFIDYAHENDGVVDALKANGLIITFASNWADFDSKLVTGNYGLAIGFSQNYSAYHYGLNVSSVQNYIHNGGRMIFTTWTYSDLPILKLFGASFSANSNLRKVTITDTGLASGLTNPFTLISQSWGVFSRGLVAINGAKVLATFENGDPAIIKGNGGSTLALGYLSDTPSVAAERDNIIVKLISAGIVVPVSIWVIIAAFLIISLGIVFAKRKVIFS